MTDALGLALAIAAATAAGLIGSFAAMRRMALAADALSHVALPGIGIAVALGIHPLIGALAMLCFAALLIWAVEPQARIPTETVIGVVFSAALAAGKAVALRWCTERLGAGGLRPPSRHLRPCSHSSEGGPRGT